MAGCEHFLTSAGCRTETSLHLVNSASTVWLRFWWELGCSTINCTYLLKESCKDKHVAYHWWPPCENANCMMVLHYFIGHWGWFTKRKTGWLLSKGNVHRSSVHLSQPITYSTSKILFNYSYTRLGIQSEHSFTFWAGRLFTPQSLCSLCSSACTFTVLFLASFFFPSQPQSLFSMQTSFLLCVYARSCASLLF